MSYYGDIRLGDTIDIKFTSRDATSTPTNLTSGTIVAYPGNSTTEVTTGITLSGSPFDTTLAGLNNIRVVATSGNGYATATNYALVLSVGTVSGTSVVGEVVASFSIENRSALMPTTAARTLTVSATGAALANLGEILGTALTETAGLLAGGFKKFFNIATPAATMDHGVLVDTVTTLTDLTVTTYAEPGQGSPAATTTLVAKIGYLYKAWRNKSTQTAALYQLLNDDAVTVDQKAVVSDDGTTFARNEVATGP